MSAIALLRSVPTNTVSSIQDTAAMIAQWQQGWTKADALFNDINKALEDGKWDKVLEYRTHLEKLHNTKYWRNKIEPLFKQAAENLVKQAFPKVENQGNQNNPQPEFTNPGTTTGSSSNIETPKDGLWN